MVEPVIDVFKKELLDKNKKKEIICDEEKRMDELIKAWKDKDIKIKK